MEGCKKELCFLIYWFVCNSLQNIPFAGIIKIHTSRRRQKMFCKIVLASLLLLLPSWSQAKTYTISGDRGGKVMKRFSQVMPRVKAGHRIRINGLCASACTINLRFGRKACATKRAKLVFHAASNGADSFATNVLWYSYPKSLQNWIRARGGLRGARLLLLTPPQLWRHVRRCR